MRVTLTMPVSMSTVASANCTPLVPLPRQALLPLAVDRDRLGADQLARVLPRQPFDGVALDVDAAAFGDQIRPASTPSVGATFANSASSASTDVTRIAGIADAAVVLPPDPPLNGSIESPISGLHRADRQAERFGRDHRDDRARAGADVLRAALHDDAAVGRDVDVRLRSAAGAAPAMRRHAHAGLDRPGRLIAGRMTLVPAELPSRRARSTRPTSRSAPRGGRFFTRNATGSIFTRSASSSIRISVRKQPCGCPGARIARCWPALM